MSSNKATCFRGQVYPRSASPALGAPIYFAFGLPLPLVNLPSSTQKAHLAAKVPLFTCWCSQRWPVWDQILSSPSSTTCRQQSLLNLGVFFHSLLAESMQSFYPLHCVLYIHIKSSSSTLRWRSGSRSWQWKYFSHGDHGSHDVWAFRTRTRFSSGFLSGEF